MGRSAILLLGIVFTIALAALTLRDLSQHGVTVPSVLGLIVAGFFAVALIGALFHPPRRP